MIKKSLFILILALAFAVSGCGNEAAEVPQNPPPAEVTPAVENTPPENVETEQDDSLTEDAGSEYDEYMASLREQSDIIKASLEEALTQHEMNAKSQELYELWDDALNYLWGELKLNLSEEEFSKLLDEQLLWISEKEKAAEEAGKEYEGGSLYALIVNSEAAEITEARVYEFYELLK